MKRRYYVYLILCLLLAAALAGFFTWRSMAERRDAEAELRAILGDEAVDSMLAQADAVAAFDALTAYFTPKGAYEPVFPANYADCAIVDGMLHVYYTGNSYEDLSRAIPKKLLDVVVFEQTAYSERYLRSLQSKVTKLVVDEQERTGQRLFTLVGVSATENCVVVELKVGSMETVQRLLEENGLADEPIYRYETNSVTTPC